MGRSPIRPTAREPFWISSTSATSKGCISLPAAWTSEKRKASITAMAQWVENYRATMTPEEKQALGAYVRSEAGRATLRQATAQYLRQDVQFRASTAPVIQELMTTLATVQKP